MIPSVFPIGAISHWPELSSPAHLRIQGGLLSVTEDGGQRTEILVPNIGWSPLKKNRKKEILMLVITKSHIRETMNLSIEADSTTGGAL